MFRYAVISLDKEHKVLSVKGYETLEDYKNAKEHMHSAFDDKKEAIREARRIARMYNLQTKIY